MSPKDSPDHQQSHSHNHTRAHARQQPFFQDQTVVCFKDFIIFHL
ncbi:hypothetical protein DSUL_50080 [Desulfovibrionales bacterium]